MDAYIGTISIFGFNFAPRNWAFCNGQLVAIASNTALFSLLGTYYGGDGKVTFGMPNFQGRTTIGMGQGPGLSDYTIGQMDGSASVTLNGLNLPAHAHSLSVQVSANDGRAGLDGPQNNFPANNDSDTIYTRTPGAGEFMAGSPLFSLLQQGGNQPMSVQRPYLTLNYCICQYGIFPPRG